MDRFSSDGAHKVRIILGKDPKAPHSSVRKGLETGYFGEKQKQEPKVLQQQYMSMCV